MALLEFSDRLPQCSRCRGNLIMSGVAPQDDEHGRPIHLEMCPVCDTYSSRRTSGHQASSSRAGRRAAPEAPIAFTTT
ncbi:DUF6300 family protein [Streptomyces nigra]|uniref:DUF6300 family protein n=2 Tax=Streptomyces nigra TaxID=1827580 RepID=UPI0036C771D8